MKIHHIGYLLDDMGSSIQSFIELGYVIDRPTCYDPIRKIDICFMKNDNIFVELVVPRGDCKLFNGLKKRIGNGPYHICYECEDFEEVIENGIEGGQLISEPEKAVAIDNKRVAFFYIPSMGIIELLDVRKQSKG